ncbi:MAG: O-antigen ligase family protein [Minisyncoccia bacterium]|jgi:O-antigen ligase
MDTIFSHPEVLAIIVGLPLLGVIAKLFGAPFRRIAKWYLYISVFAVVIVMDSMFFPFIGGKDYFFRFSIELSLIFFVLAWAFEMREGELAQLLKTTFKKPLVIAVTAFVVMVLLACLFAYDIHAAFWSNYERGEGGFQMIHYYLFFLLLVLLLRTEGEWKNIFRFSLVAGGLMILYGIFGNFLVAGFISPFAGGGTPAPGWLHKIIDPRFQGSLGNPAYVAPYLLFSMFYAAYLWVKRKKGAVTSALVHIGYAVLIVIFLFFFILAQTRGAFLGLGAGVFLLMLYLVIAGRGTLRKWSLVGLILVIVAGGTVFSLRNSSLVQSFPAGRLLQINFSDATAQTRFWVWNEAWKGFLERPILGWGLENFAPVYDKYFDPRFFIPAAQGIETWFDRAHSVFFDYLAETGALGLLSYLGIFAVLAWEFFLGKKRANDRTSAAVLERGLILALPAAYLVQGVAIFDVLPMYVNLFLFMAFACYYFYQNHGQNA